MSAKPAAYRRLAGASYGASGRARLWLGGDHLLEVGSWVAAERYRRFPLADIRALVVEPTRASFIWSAVTGPLFFLAALAIAAAAWSAMRASDRDTAIWLWIFVGMSAAPALALLGLFLANLLRGPSCRCSLQTGAGIRVLATPTRQRMADRVLQQLAAEIETAQAAPRP